MKYYRGGELVLGWNGKQEKWTADEIAADLDVKHEATDYQLNSDGSVKRDSSTGAILRQTADPDLGAEEGDLKVRRVGEPMVGAFSAQEVHTATDEVVIKESTDYVVTDGQLNYTGTGAATQVATTVYAKKGGGTTTDPNLAELHKDGDLKVAREGQARLGYTWAAGVWTPAPITDDEADDTYLAPSFTAPLVATLDDNDTLEIAFYKGGEAIIGYATQQLGNYEGGEAVADTRQG